MRLAGTVPGSTTAKQLARGLYLHVETRAASRKKPQDNRSVECEAIVRVSSGSVPVQRNGFNLLTHERRDDRTVFHYPWPDNREV